MPRPRLFYVNEITDNALEVELVEEDYSHEYCSVVIVNPPVKWGDFVKIAVRKSRLFVEVK